MVSLDSGIKQSIAMAKSITYSPTFLLLLTSTLTLVCNTMAKTTVYVTAPVNPVKENGILSIHCLISDLQIDHEVTISRNIGNHTQTLSWNGLIAVENDPRIFLAVRQLSDGDIVYFMSITEAMRSDEGTYTCKVLKSGKLNTIAEGTTPLLFQYFPTEPPACNPEASLPPVYAGTAINLNCSSVAARPSVGITWSRTGGSDIPSKSIVSGPTVYNSVVFRPSIRDDGVLFFCKVTSPAFPTKMSTCHIGPLKVIPNPYATEEDNSDINSPVTLPEQPDIIDYVDIDSGDTIDPSIDREDILQCHDVCRLRSTSSVFYWVIAAFLAGIVAFTFCIVAVMIAVRLHRAKRQMTLHRMAARHHTHQDIYLELDEKFDENRVYMSLDQCRKVYQPKMETGCTYTSTPIAPKGPII